MVSIFGETVISYHSSRAYTHTHTYIYDETAVDGID
jgi:hypothetical protein